MCFKGGIDSVLLLLPKGLAYFPAELERIQRSVLATSMYQIVKSNLGPKMQSLT